MSLFDFLKKKEINVGFTFEETNEHVIVETYISPDDKRWVFMPHSNNKLFIKEHLNEIKELSKEIGVHKKILFGGTMVDFNKGVIVFLDGVSADPFSPDSCKKDTFPISKTVGLFMQKSPTPK